MGLRSASCHSLPTFGQRVYQGESDVGNQAIEFICHYLISGGFVRGVVYVGVISGLCFDEIDILLHLSMIGSLKSLAG